MRIRRDELARVARLARLHFDAPELDRLAVELDAIVEHMQVLRTLELDGVAPFPLPERDAHVTAALRPDVPGADELLRAPAQLAESFREGFFTVPRLPAHEEPAAP